MSAPNRTNQIPAKINVGWMMPDNNGVYISTDSSVNNYLDLTSMTLYSKTYSGTTTGNGDGGTIFIGVNLLAGPIMKLSNGKSIQIADVDWLYLYNGSDLLSKLENTGLIFIDGNSKGYDLGNGNFLLARSEGIFYEYNTNTNTLVFSSSASLYNASCPFDIVTNTIFVYNNNYVFTVGDDATDTYINLSIGQLN
jgi:hypothetical protein